MGRCVAPWHFFLLVGCQFLVIDGASSSKSEIDESCTNSWTKKLDSNSEKETWSRILTLVKQLQENAKNGIFRSENGKFQFSFCSDPSSGARPKLTGGVWNKDDKTLLGDSDHAVVEYAGSNNSWVSLHMKNGDSCKSECNTTVQNRATILIVCDPEASKVKFSAISSNIDCSYTFILSTKLVCDIKHLEVPDSKSESSHSSDKKSSHFSGLGFFFFSLGFFVVAYFALGFLYKRHVLGARGVEQIPNYLFWLRLFRNLQAFFATGSPYQRSARHDQRYRNYDDDFRYDQPPLMADDQSEQPFSGGGGADEGRLSSTARRLSSTANSNAAGAKDDADVRLLVV